MTTPRIEELPLLLKAKDAAAILGMTRWGIYDLVRTGRLVAVGRSRGQYVFRLAEVLRVGGIADAPPRSRSRRAKNGNGLAGAHGIAAAASRSTEEGRERLGSDPRG